MDAREAAAAAKQHVQYLFADENISSIGLEEIRFEQGNEPTWLVTIGFSRDWQSEGSFLRPLFPASRVYKIVTIDPSDGSLKSITHRDIPSQQTA